MRIIAIKPSAKNLVLIVAEGDSASQNLIKYEPEVYKFSSVNDQTKILLDTNVFLKTVIDELKIDAVHILTAGNSQFGRISADRVKIEASIQLATAEKNKRIKLIPAQTLAAAKKRAVEKGFESVDLTFKHKFSSEDKRDAAIIALFGLAPW